MAQLGSREMSTLTAILKG